MTLKMTSIISNGMTCKNLNPNNRLQEAIGAKARLSLNRDGG